MPSDPRANLFFTKILATLGPASVSVDAIRQLIRAGARAFCIAFSHGTLDDHRQVLGDRLGQSNLSNLVYIHRVGSL